MTTTTRYIIESESDITSSSSEEEEEEDMKPLSSVSENVRSRKIFPGAPLIQVTDQSSPAESELDIPFDPMDNLEDRFKMWKHH